MEGWDNGIMMLVLPASAMAQEALRLGFLFDAVRGEGVEIHRSNVGDVFVAKYVMHCSRRCKKQRGMHDTDFSLYLYLPMK